MPETLYIVDTFSLLFQVFHAIRQPMTGSRGQPTNAVFGFIGDLEHLIRDKQPTHLIYAFESPPSAEPDERTKLYPAYKANRSAMPEDLRPQIPMVIDVLAGYRVPVVSSPGWEADDVIATLSRMAVERGMDVRIVTNDKDARQLINPQCKIYSIRKKMFLAEEELMAEWGVRPDQVIDFQSLVGDSVDNVPGVPQIGPKTATQLLNQYGTLEEVLAHAADVKGKKVSENLRDFKDQAYLSRTLVTLNQGLPLDIDWEAAKIQEPDHERLLTLFNDFGFRRYANDAQVKVREKQIKPANEHPREWQVIRDAKTFNDFRKRLEQQQRFCLDLETSSTNPLEANIVGWAFCWEADVGYYIPVDGPGNLSKKGADPVGPGSQRVRSLFPHAAKDTNFLPPEDVRDALKSILEDPTKEVVNQNIKYELLVLRRAGINVPTEAIGLDPMVGDYLLDPGARGHGLEELSKRYLLRAMIPISDLIGKGQRQLKMFEVEIDKVAEYASEDADVAWQVANIITSRLQEEGLTELYWKLERPLIPVLAEMEWNGIRINSQELRIQSDAVSVRLEELITEIHQAAGRQFNPDSPKQLATILFDELKLPVLKRTKTGPSTDQEVLEELSLQHELPRKLMEHRILKKLQGTYLDALPSQVNPRTGKIHTSFNQTTAATGRLSSSDPNLQNIPIRTEEGRRIRKAFIPSEPDWVLVCLDYSQIELRILAHFCQDPAMLEAFHREEDIHRRVASEVFGVPQDQVTSDQRRVAKAVNFGVIYGQTAFGLANALDIEKTEAGVFIKDYFARYPEVQKFMDRTLDEVRVSGFAKTILGRRREIVGIRGNRWGNMNLPERTAVNTVIQGSAADLIKQAMLNVHAKLKETNHPGRLLLQIHDELVFESPASAAEDLLNLARHEMQHALPLAVPVVVDGKIGENWLDAK